MHHACLTFVCVCDRGSSEAEATSDVINVQLPAIQRLREAGELCVENIDVFHEQGVFGTESTRQILIAGKNAGMELNFHGDELHFNASAEVRSCSAVLLQSTLLLTRNAADWCAVAVFYSLARNEILKRCSFFCSYFGTVFPSMW